MFNPLSGLKVGGLALLDQFNSTFEPWKEFDRAAEPKYKEVTQESLKNYYTGDLVKYTTPFSDIFRITEKTDLGDSCIWQGVYSAMNSLVNLRQKKLGPEGLAYYVTREGILLRGIAGKDSPWLVVDPNNSNHYKEDGDLILRDDASLDSLAGFCFGAAMAIRCGNFSEELRRSILVLAARLHENNYRLKNLDGSFTQYGDCRPGLFQAPVRTLAAAVISYLGWRCGSKFDDWKGIVKDFGYEFSRTESHLLWNHPWFNDNLAILLTGAAMLLNKEFGDAKTGFKNLLKKHVEYGNAFAIYLAMNCEITPSTSELEIAEKVMSEFYNEEGKAACVVKNLNYPSVNYHGQRVATQPVPMWRRPNADFFWQRNPYSLEGGDGNDYPGLDFLIAYYLREKHDTF